MKANKPKATTSKKRISKKKIKPHQIKKSKKFLEFKTEINELFLSKILKLQKAIHLDDLKEFETDFKKFIEDNQIKELKPICLELEANILTFNVDSIFAILRDLEKFLTEE